MLTSLVRFLPLYFVALIAANAALAQAPPTPPSPPTPVPAPPPPPHNPAVQIDRGPDRGLRVDLHCAEGDTTRGCIDLATQLFDRLNIAVQAK